MGNGSTSNQTTPVQVSSITTAVAVASGHQHSCAVLADTTVKCWGSGTNGQLGNGGNVVSTTPVTVTGMSGVTAIAAGTSYTCALASGSVSCWGLNASGQLGNGTTTTSLTPQTITGLSGVTKIAAGATHVAALLSDKSLWVWGAGAVYGLGTGNGTDQTAPVSRGGSWSKVAAGTNFTILYP